MDSCDYRAAPSAAVGRELCVPCEGSRGGGAGATGPPRVSGLRAGKMAWGSEEVYFWDAGESWRKQEEGGGRHLGRGSAWVRETVLITDVEAKTQAATQGHPQDGPAEKPRVRRDVTMIFTNHPSFTFGHTGKLHIQKLSCVRQNKIYLAKRQQSWKRCTFNKILIFHCPKPIGFKCVFLS